MRDKFNLKGKMKIITSKNGKVIRETPMYNNLIVDGTDTGFNLILDRLYGTNTYSLNITHLDIGTAITAPALSDTTLGSAVARTAVATKVQGSDDITFRFFFADGDLPNDDYEEVGLFIDGSTGVSTGRMFSHALFGSTYTKSLGEDSTLEYIISKL
jgi:hypothetical protein